MFRRWAALAAAAAAVAAPTMLAPAPIQPDGEPIVTIQGTICYENQNNMLGGSATELEMNTGPYLSLQLSEPSREEVLVFLATQDGTAKAPYDYLPFRQYKVAFPPGTTRAQVRVEIVADRELEPDEYFFVVIESVLGARPGNRRAVVIIKDGSAQPVLP